MEKNKDHEKGDVQRAQTEALECLREEARKTSSIATQHSPQGLYQKSNFVSIFMAVDKKL